jgi:hypothetical protein
MGKKKEEMRCKDHPEFDPRDKSQQGRENKECPVCCALHHGVEYIGSYGGEHKASKHHIDRAKIKIGPMNLEQFGHVRFALGWDYHFEDSAPSWYVDEEAMTIYLSDGLDNKRIEEFRDEYKCKVFSRQWTEPKLTSINFATSEEEKSSVLSMTFGDSNTVVSVTIKDGMTGEEVRDALDKLTSNLFDLPKDNVMETEILE